MSNFTNGNKKIILFRADDLNGATAEIVLSFGAKEKIDKVVECTRETIDEALLSFLKSKEFYDYKRVYIVGLEFDKKIADKIEELYRDDRIDTMFYYRDHHEENTELHKYMWGKVIVLDHKGIPMCSSRKLFREFVPQSHPKHLRLLILTDIVNAIVTGVIGEEEEYMANKMIELYNVANSSSDFVRDMNEKIMSNEPFFNEADLLAIQEAKRLKEEEEMEKLMQLREKLNFSNSNKGL